MDYSAHHRFADMSARKVRPFATLIRGLRADEALEALRFYPNKGARLLEDVLKSALGNAEDRGAREIEDLLVVGNT
jgi:large subunit ribosomal protein L22